MARVSFRAAREGNERRGLQFFYILLMIFLLLCTATLLPKRELTWRKSILKERKHFSRPLSLLPFANALWTVTYSNYPSGIVAPMIQEQVLSRSGTQFVRFVHDSVSFDSGLGRDKTIFPGSCTSSSQNAYGFNRWKNELFSQYTPNVNAKSITLFLTGVPAFSPTENETVTCFPGEVGKNGVSYIRGVNSTLPAEDVSVSFTIMRTSAAPKVRMKWRGSLDSTLEAETFIRENGFYLTIMLDNDVWITTDAVERVLLSSLSCAPVRTMVAWEGVDCAWLSSILQQKKYRSFNTSQPNMYYVYVPRSETRMLNIMEKMEISLNLPRSNGERYGLKTGFNLDLFSSDSRVFVDATVNVPYVTMWRTPYFDYSKAKEAKVNESNKNCTTYEITEACFRGRAPNDEHCTRTIWFNIDSAVAQSRSTFFAPESTANVRDWNETGVYSEYFKKVLSVAPFINAVEGVDGPVGDKRETLNQIFWLRPMIEYDIVSRDTLRLRIPFNYFSTFEPPPPSNVLTITVVPSPGEVMQWHVPNLTQNTLWRGGSTMRVKLGGESFRDEAPAAFLSFFVGSLGGSDGWGRWLGCTANTSNGATVNFEKVNITNSDGQRELVEDKQSIVVVLSPCPEYLMGPSSEQVTATVPYSAFASLQPLTSTSALSFTITKSPGMYAISGRLKYLEEEMINGTVDLSLRFLGGEYLVADTDDVSWSSCLNALVDSWTTSSTSDANGWNSREVRQGLFGPGAVTRLSDTNLRIKFVPKPTYDTRRGEMINISTMPKECFLSGNTVYASESTHLDVKPMRGTVRLGYQYPTSSVVWESNVTESMMRRGGFSWIVDLEGDTFDDDHMSDFGTAIAFADLTTDSYEPSGFAALKSSLIDPRAIVYDNVTRKRISIPIRSTAKFDVRNDEDVTVKVNARWMTSQQQPTNEPNSLFFTIAKSAGDIILEEWYGKHRPVTEQDIREGRVWFRFGLLGDQWRAERAPYVAAFSSNESSPTGFMALVEQIVPAVDFFAFTSSDAYEYLTIRLQPNDKYDIATDEVLVLSFPGTTVVSDLPPAFSGTGVVNGKQYITIKVVPGRVILSGMTSLNEKMVRQGGVQMYLTLFGEQWLSDVTAASLCVRQASRSLLRDQLFNTTILPYTGSSGTGQSSVYRESPSVMVVPFSSDKSQTINYDIEANAVDIFSFGLISRCVQSGLEPSRSSLRALIEPTEGELRLESLSPPVISEVTLRTVGFTIKFQLDGDQWAEDVKLSERATELVGGFGSLSSSITEPEGFYANRQVMLGLSLGQSPDVRITTNTLEVIVHPTSGYNIDNDETLTFSVPSDTFVLGGALPNPSTVSFTVLAITRTIILIVDPSRPGSMSNGRFDTDNLRIKIAAVLSCQDLTRISVTLNTTRPDNLVVVPLIFRGSTSSSERRSNGQLGTMFMGYSVSYLDAQLGIKYAYWEDIGAATEESTDGGKSNGGRGNSNSEESTATMIWGLVAAGFIIVVVIGYFVVMRVRQAELGGLVRKGLSPVHSNRYGVVEENEERNEGGDSSNMAAEMKNFRNSPASSSSTRASEARGKGSLRFGASESSRRTRGGGGSDGGGGSSSGEGQQQYRHATRMFAEKLARQREQHRQHSGGASLLLDPSNPDLIPRDPLVDRPMSLKEYAHRRLLERDADARKVHEIVESARRRMRASVEMDDENYSPMREPDPSSWGVAADEVGLMRRRGGVSPELDTTSLPREERRARLALAEDILNRKRREAGELAARERDVRRRAGAGLASSAVGIDDPAESGLHDLAEERRRATQARIEQMLEGLS